MTHAFPRMYLKPFKKLAARVLSGQKPSATPRGFKPDKTLLLGFLNITQNVGNNRSPSAQGA